MIDWIITNYFEILGVVTGLVFIYFSIKQKVICWPFGIVNSALYIIIYLSAKLYANSGLQVYYLIMGFYGWNYWVNGPNQNKSGKNVVPVKHLTLKIIIISSIIGTIIQVILLWILRTQNDPFPALDAFTTMLSFIATWMLAKKYIETWILWIFIDMISVGLYSSMKMFPTAGLFLVYTIMAIIGYLEWKKELRVK